MLSSDKGYQTPAKSIVDLVDVPPVPAVSMSPDRKTLLLLERKGLPAIEDIASEELRLAGLRIDPTTCSPSRSGYFTKIIVKNGNKEALIEGLPQSSKIRHVSWSPDSSKLAFTLTTNEGLELWFADVRLKKAQRLTGPVVNAALGGKPCQWLPESQSILLKTRVDTATFPEKPKVPTGPQIQENDGKTSAVRTYQDLLKNAYDELLFEFYATSQYHEVSLDGKKKAIGDKAMFRVCSPSPDGQYFLVFTIQKPFSYIVPYHQFPASVVIWDRNGNEVQKIADIPVADDIPKGFGAVRKGPRSFYWRADHVATLYWAEALDEGDPKKEVEWRDQIFFWQAPFHKQPEKSIATKLRFGGLTWGDKELALVEEWQWKNRLIVTSTFSPDFPERGIKTVFKRSWEDRYNDPGRFQTIRNELGRYALLTTPDKINLFLIGDGDSPEGKRPFVHKFNLQTGETIPLWRSEAPYFETPIDILGIEPLKVVTRRESKTEPPNYFIRDLEKNLLEPITDFRHPYEHLKDINREIIQYKREDGVDLQGKLYLPVGYNPVKSGPIPILLWAYPREFKSSDAAGQMTDSPYQFTRLLSLSPLMLLTRGYGVLHSFSMPVIGEGDEEPNERFVQQIAANASAAIEKLVDMGVGHRDKMAIGGHSYGAFMAANLLAHTDLFAAGIARSGAYNRTLTPFGFQSEERTYWEAKETYMEMSPFSFADKIKTPLLLIHGEADNNSGTYPLQSERFYNALKGHGAEVRLVMLPHESHGYQARESILHVFWEMERWLERYLK
ncbi:MAG: prolyl oligopeptidase family serine peptidase [Bacteroidota bacterium]